MTRIGVVTRAALVALALAAPALADAPIGGPDQQYRNFDPSNRTIFDRFTHLEWDRPLSTSSTPYPAARRFADAPAACPNGMRLPSLKELLTIVDETPHYEYDTALGENVARSIDQNAFGGTPAEEFWTSSTDGARVWVVDFSDGTTHSVNTTGKDARVRCVKFVP